MALTKFNYNSFDVTSAASTALGFNASANGFATINPGSMTLIKTLTASSSANLSFVDGSSSVVLDNTYPVYMFKFINMHPASDDVKLNVNFRDGGSSYDATKTTTAFSASHYENDSAYAFQYEVTKDLAQSTAVQPVHINIFKGSVSDASVCGELILFNPSSTTFVKHFIVRAVNMGNDGSNAFSEDSFIAGYCNTTTAIDGVQFTMDSGNIDAGTIKLYGVKDS